MFFKSGNLDGVIIPQATCPGITCSYTCKLSEADLKATEKVSASENKASVKQGSSPKT